MDPSPSFDASTAKTSLRGSSSPAGQSTTARGFAAHLLATAFAVVLGCGLFNAVVDPHGLFRWVDRTGFNEIKPRAAQVSVAFKYRAVDFGLPQTLILGNSRAEMGWDPDLLPMARFGSAVNAAMPGKGLEAMIAVADHAWIRSKPSTLLIGLEFFDCLEAGQAPVMGPQDSSPWQATDPEPSLRLDRLGAFAAQALSLDAAADSLQTLVAQRIPHAAHLRRDGFQPAREYPRMQAVDSAHKMFLQRDQENARMRVNGPKSIRYRNGQLSECFDALDQLLGDAQERGQYVFLATYPYHARLLEVIWSAGLWQPYEEWKLALVERVDARRRSGLNVNLRDFGAYHTYAVEPIPGAGQFQPSPKWYWESGHFRAELGARMLDVMLGTYSSDRLYGVELTPETVATHLGEVRVSRAAFAASQPDVVAAIADIAARACRNLEPKKKAHC